MSKRLVFISSLPISRIFGEKLGASRFREAGFETTFLDATPLYYPPERLQAYYAGDKSYRISDPEPQLVSREEELRSAIDSLEEGDIVWHLSRFFKSSEDDAVFEALQQRNIPYYLQHFDTVPTPPGMLSRLRMRARFYRHRRFNSKLRPAGIVGSGSLGRRQSSELFPDTPFLSIPSVKVLWQAEEKLIGEYILFVDENIEYAPDAILLGYEVSNDVDGYYERMNQLFASIEAWTGKPVVVSASGKYRYTRDRFQGRQLLYGKTLPLIQGASLVIGHMSLALEQCLVSEVPFFIVEDQSFTTEKYVGFSQSLLNKLQQPIMNTAVTKEALVGRTKFDLKKTRALVSTFLREDGATTPYHERVAEEFKHVWTQPRFRR